MAIFSTRVPSLQEENKNEKKERKDLAVSHSLQTCVNADMVDLN